MHFLQRLKRPKRTLLFIKALVLRTEHDILHDRLFKELVLRILEYDTDLCPQILQVILLVINILPIIVYGSARRFEKTI